MTEPKLKVALLGAGGRGRAVLGNWLELCNCEIAAVVDPSPASLDATRRAYDGAVSQTVFTTDINAWLQHPNADIVTINSWDPQHAENAIACFNAGLNVQVAKPMTQSTADADAVYCAWRRSGRIGVVDMQIRTSELCIAAMELIRDGKLGNIHLINCFDYVGRSGVEFRNSRSRQRALIKSWTLAKGVHFLDLLNMFMQSDPVRVYASGSRSVFGGERENDRKCASCPERDSCLFDGRKLVIGGIPYPKTNAGCVFTKETDINDNVCAVIDYANGGRATYNECYFTPEYQTTYEIIGDRGAMFVRYAMDNRLYLEYRPLGSAQIERTNIYPKGIAHGGGDRNIILALDEAIRTDTQIQPDIRAGRYAVALAEAIDQSADRRAVVEVPAPPTVQHKTVPNGNLAAVD